MPGKVWKNLGPIALHCIALYWWACQKKFGLQLHCQLHAAPLNPRKMRLTLDWHPANIHRSIAHLAHCPVPNGQKNHRNTQETQIHKYTNTQTHKYTNTQTLWIGILQIFTAQLPTLTSAHHKCEKNHRNTKEKHIHKHTNTQTNKYSNTLKWYPANIHYTHTRHQNVLNSHFRLAKH